IEQQNIEEAIYGIEQYKKIFKYDDELASMEAIIKIYNDDLNEALNCIRDGLKCNINNTDLYYTMGNIYELKKEYDRAYLCYEHTIEIELLNNKEKNTNLALRAIDNLKSNFKISVNNYSIIILTYNNLEYTKVCFNSIKKYNLSSNYEIIIIDNNSTDGTVEWIKQQKGIKYILNNENKGFPIGCNQGIKIADKNNDIFLLNNDTVIMPNSIFNLRMGLYSKENIGATGAVSNNVANNQKVINEYDDFDIYMKFALTNNITNENLYDERIRLIGFAMLIKRCVLEKVGLLDERFTPGNYEDDDISLRILLCNYKIILCRDSYIHHFGSVSFGKDVDKYNKILDTNKNKFKEKWGFISSYYTYIRYDLINLIDEPIDRSINILEVGCACGSTLLEIKNKYRNANLYGIELNDSVVNIAKHVADVRCGNIENFDFSVYKEESFDYIIFGDVLEHLNNPDKIINEILKYLNKDGYVLASIPNVMHFSVLKDLLINGNWTYQEDGILDRTHLRFFTKNEIIKLFYNNGYLIDKMSCIMTDKSDEDQKFIDNLKVFNKENSFEYEVYQYLIKAKKLSKSNRKE
ncbi:bifunctional glycosyltransferase family 2 protein/class I SAM-dependent methyltransferase, partial [uncultured Clostridium sp.]|uniref:bifunctional glycosyltransferase family 2 protein/class I SAM-dependent methyltransferase n=1 Tax=uncultured Clostridium sp. TaxID=59620 RepID=UPI0025E9F39F